MNQVKGLSQVAAHQVVQTRAHRAFASLADFLERAPVNTQQRHLLAAANALQTLSRHRRQAGWEVALPQHQGLLQTAPIAENHVVQFAPPTEAQAILADYRSQGLTLGRHPLALLRHLLQARRFEPASTLLEHYPDRRLARACGVVTSRQRPQTAKGTIFVTLEDETGHVNVVVHNNVAQRQAQELLQARLLGVYGVWQRQHGVCHLVANRLVDLSHFLGNLPTRSRNFH